MDSKTGIHKLRNGRTTKYRIVFPLQITLFTAVFLVTVVFKLSDGILIIRIARGVQKEIVLLFRVEFGYYDVNHSNTSVPLYY
jgi:hypothetical protein